MPVVKGKYSLNFTTIPNSTLQDSRLSFEARGVLCLMLSMPADWVMYKSWLVEQCAMTGRDKMTRILKELESGKYLVREKKRDESGRFDSYDWFVYPEPFTGNGLAVDGSAVNGKSVTTKDTYLQNKHHTNQEVDKDLIQYEKIKELYNRILGKDLGAVRSITGQRKKHIKARINEDQKRKSLDWWEHYFYAVQQMPFLIGRGPVRPDTGKPWIADFDWLINETNMVKVLEGKYADR